MAIRLRCSVNITSSPIDVQVADMNGDGLPDFVTIHGYMGEGKVALTTFNGSTPQFVKMTTSQYTDTTSGQGRTSMRTLRVGRFLRSW